MGHIDRPDVVAGHSSCQDIGIYRFGRMSCRAQCMAGYLVNATIYDTLPYVCIYIYIYIYI